LGSVKPVGGVNGRRAMAAATAVLSLGTVAYVVAPKHPAQIVGASSAALPS